MIVVLAVFDRPEFLSICLEHIAKTDEADKNEYLFACDYGFDRANLDVIEKFPFKYSILEQTDKGYTGGKLSFNVFNALLKAAYSYQLVCYLEDDIFIGRDFFTFAKDVHLKEPGLFCLTLSRNINTVDNTTDNPNAYYLKQNTADHQFYGNVFNSYLLIKYLDQYFSDEYFRDTTAYVAQNFPNSGLDNGFSELDGLFRRVIQKHNLMIGFAHIPRCFHAGFKGLHRNPNFDYVCLSFDERVKVIKEYAFDIEKLKRIVENPNYALDSVPINLLSSHTETINEPLK